MDISNLKVTLNAYSKLAPTILKDYVTKEDLETTLQGYVEEAPVDSEAYARHNKSWIEVSPDAIRPDIKLFYGVNSLTELSNKDDIADFTKQFFTNDTKTYIIDYNQTKNGYFWIVCNVKPLNILWMGTLADFIEQEQPIESETGERLYCYRLLEETIVQHLGFTINF